MNDDLFEAMAILISGAVLGVWLGIAVGPLWSYAVIGAGVAATATIVNRRRITRWARLTVTLSVRRIRRIWSNTRQAI